MTVGHMLIPLCFCCTQQQLHMWQANLSEGLHWSMYRIQLLRLCNLSVHDDMACHQYLCPSLLFLHLDPLRFCSKLSE